MVTTTAWAHLPNAALIDEILSSLRADPDKWATAAFLAGGPAMNAARDAARDASWVSTRDAAVNASRGAAWDAIWDVAWPEVRNVAISAARGAAWDTVLILITCDSAGQFVKLSPDHLKVLYRINPQPMFLLLQPAAHVFSSTTGGPYETVSNSIDDAKNPRLWPHALHLGRPRCRQE